MNTPYLLFWTAENLEEAKKVARILIEKKAAGCCSILGDTFSIYRWEGTIEEQTECKVLIKTMQKKLPIVEKLIIENASYEVPELLSMKMDRCHPNYLKWLEKSLNI